MSTKATTAKPLISDLEYKDSTLYKMILILSGFRVLSNSNGYDFVQRLRKLNGMDWKYYNSDPFGLISWIDQGMIKLNKAEVMEYSDYICVVFGIPIRNREFFYNNLMDFAVNQMPASMRDVTPSNLAMLKCHGMIYLKTLSERGGNKND
jgi:hypothetical protein